MGKFKYKIFNFTKKAHPEMRCAILYSIAAAKNENESNYDDPAKIIVIEKITQAVVHILLRKIY